MPYKQPKPEYVQARIGELDKYGWLGTIDVLADGDVDKWTRIMSMSFERTIMKLALNRDVSAYQERLNKVLKGKNERK